MGLAGVNLPENELGTRQSASLGAHNKENRENGEGGGTSLRPPALSKRARHEYCFYFDLLPESQHLMASLIRYVVAYGARYSAFLDVNVTHIITDKPKQVVESSALVLKWGTKVLGLADFLSKIVESYKRCSVNVLPISPTIQRAASETNQKRDLEQLLAEERKFGINPTTKTGRGITPLYNAAAGAAGGKISTNLTTAMRKGIRSGVNPAAGAKNAESESRKISFVAFQHPYVMIEDTQMACAPLFKEYVPNSSNGEPTFPTLHYDQLDFYCPWVPPDRISADGIKKVPTITHPPPPNYRPTASTMASGQSVPGGKPTKRNITLQRLAKYNPNHHTFENGNRFTSALGLAPIPILKGSPGSAGPSNSKPAIDRPRPGYCECCYEKYSNLERHLGEEKHRKFASDCRTYRCVDTIIEAIVRPLCRASNAARQEAESTFPSPGKETPPSPAKSVAAAISSGEYVKGSAPLYNITNHSIGRRSPCKITMSPLPAFEAPMGDANKSKYNAGGLELVEIASDSPLYSSPSFKRRRSQRLARAKSITTLTATKFVL